MAKKALITGIIGQDGSYLAELLIEKGYEVHGLARAPLSVQQSWLAPLRKHCDSRLFLHTGDIRETKALTSLIAEVRPEEIYHFAGMTHVVASFDDPEAALELNAMVTVRLLEAMRRLGSGHKLFHASSSEIFGSPAQSPQDEDTPVRPLNPYACAKACAGYMLAVYRQTYGLFAVNGILYNHESPRRGEQFVTRQICRAAASAKLGQPVDLLLGDLTALRDWGDARDYVLGMWLALQHTAAEDYVFATGELHTVQELVEIAFRSVGLDWRQFVKRDANFNRPTDPRRMVGNAAKAKRLLGWAPRTSFEQLVREMVETELARLLRT